MNAIVFNDGFADEHEAKTVLELFVTFARYEALISLSFERFQIVSCNEFCSLSGEAGTQRDIAAVSA